MQFGWQDKQEPVEKRGGGEGLRYKERRLQEIEKL